MIQPTSGPAVPPLNDRDAKLRETAQQLEGVFVAQLYQAMRDTIPDDGLMSGGSGEEMFTGLMDQQMATATPAQWGGHGLTDALVRQLRAQLGGGGS
ncbi:MAG: rod-binding protein [Gemmatimonadaceae bacterium]|nr:rod-binding protein [Gemmatimonadaceae bacterium]